MSSLDPCDFPIGSSVTDGGDKPFCPDEPLVNALYRLNSTGDPMILEALHLDEGRQASPPHEPAGFGSQDQHRTRRELASRDRSSSTQPSGAFAGKEMMPV